MTSTEVGDVVRVGRSRVHVTRLGSAGEIYGHATKHCDEGGCSGDERYFQRGPGRPPGKSDDSEPVLLKLSPALLAAVTAAAESAGVSRVEWLRRAAAYCVATKVPLAHVSVS